MLVTTIAGAGGLGVANCNLFSTNIRLIAIKAQSNPWGIFAYAKTGMPIPGAAIALVTS